MTTHTPRNFVLQLGALIALYVSLSSLLVLLFGIINLSFPDPADSVWAIDSAQSSIRFSIATLVVVFPVFLLLQRQVNQLRRHAADTSYLGLTKWLIYLSLLIGAGVLLGDLVTVIMTYLEGEITTRFIAKAASVLVVVGAALHYYFLDLRQYWLTHESRSILYTIGAIVVVFTSLTFGVSLVDTPAEVREQKIDEQQVNDLSNIEWHIADYIRANDALPETVDDAYTSGVAAPLAPEDRTAYEYRQTEEGFALCAEFDQASTRTDYQGRPVAPSLDERQPLIENAGNWEHGTGWVCFERTVNMDSLE